MLITHTECYLSYYFGMYKAI